MLKKILKWTVFIILCLLIILAITVASRQHLQFSAPYPEIKASTDSAVLARGRYLVNGPAHCADCHANHEFQEAVNKGQEVALSGGRKFEIPIGVIYSRNLTSDETGIANYTDQQIARSLRYGVGVDGRALFDFMPFHNASDADLTAIISYIRTFKPVQNKIPENEMNLLGKIVKAFLIKPVGPDYEPPKTVAADSTAAYGKYLARSVSNCRGCHTNRDLMTGAFIGQEFAGGFKMESVTDPKHFSCVSPNLTPDVTTGHIVQWNEALFIKRFHSGKLIPHSPMPWGPFSRMSDDELKAIYRYLATLTPIKTIRDHLWLKFNKEVVSRKDAERNNGNAAGSGNHNSLKQKFLHQKIRYMKFKPNQKILAACLIVCSIACNSHSDTSATSATTPAEQKYSGPTNKDVYDAINNNNWAKLDSLIAKDAVDHSAMATINGLDSIKVMLKEFKAGFPDLKMEAMDEAISGDMIFTRYHWTGTNTGMMNGMPGTNKKIEVTGVDLARAKDGKLVEHWEYSDNLAFYKQLGVDPLAPPPAKKK